MRTVKKGGGIKLHMCKRALIAVLAMIAPPMAISQELFGDTFYFETESPFATSGFNNRAAFLYNFNSDGDGNFEFRCTDNAFLHFINPLGDERRDDLRLGDPNSDVSVRIAIDGEVSEINALVSPTGASIYGQPLASLSLLMILSEGASDFAFSIVGRGGEVISDNFRIAEEDKTAFRRVAENCDLGASLSR